MHRLITKECIMKKLLIILFSIGIGLGASAQKYAYRYPGPGVRYYARPRVSIGIGAFAPPLYGYYRSPYAYSPFYRPYYRPYNYQARPTKLDLQIEDIKNDYEQRIWDVKHDENLSRKERKRAIKVLITERDREITQAKKDYYNY